MQDINELNELFEYGDILNSPFEAFPGSGKWFPIKPHWHYFTEILYVTSGTLETESNGKVYTLNQDDLIIYHPKSIHSIYSKAQNNNAITINDDNQYVQYVVLKFDSHILNNSVPGTPKISRIMDNASSKQELDIVFRAVQMRHLPMREYFFNCVQEMRDRQFGYDTVVYSLLSNLLTDLIRIWISKGFNATERDTDKSDDNPFYSVPEYIDVHSAENITVKAIADRCGMSYSNFAKQFKLQYGKSCKEYIEFIRICKADNLLLFTNYPLAYISAETGFTDSSHFIKTYKRIRGITPKQRRMGKTFVY